MIKHKHKVNSNILTHLAKYSRAQSRTDASYKCILYRVGYIEQNRWFYSAKECFNRNKRLEVNKKTSENAVIDVVGEKEF